VFHADQNPNNILVRPEAGADAATLLDFDRARLGRPPLGARARRRNLRRLARSLAKLDPEGALAAAGEAAAFARAYAMALRARGVEGRCAR
jgi:hypothetical protein